jgi:hypothetical protein
MGVVLPLGYSHVIRRCQTRDGAGEGRLVLALTPATGVANPVVRSYVDPAPRSPRELRLRELAGETLDVVCKTGDPGPSRRRLQSTTTSG